MLEILNHILELRKDFKTMSATIEQLTAMAKQFADFAPKLGADLAALLNYHAANPNPDLEPILTSLQGTLSTLQAIDTSAIAAVPTVDPNAPVVEPVDPNAVTPPIV
jgi:Zn-dependent M32 family carboxypeptidase